MDALWDNDAQSIVDTVSSEISELTDDEWDDDEEDLQEVTDLTDSRKYIVYQSALIELYKQVRTSTLWCAVIIGSCYIFPGLFFLLCPHVVLGLIFEVVVLCWWGSGPVMWGLILVFLGLGLFI